MLHLHQYLFNQVLVLLGNSKSYWASSLGYLSTLVILAIISVLVYYAVKLIALRIIKHMFEKSGSLFLHTIAENKALNLTAHLAAGIIFYLGSNFVDVHDQMQPVLHIIVTDITIFVIFLLIIFTINRLIWSINTYYDKKFAVAARYPIFSYLRVLMLIVWVIGLILISAFFAHTSPIALLTGIGAVSAVFLLIFRDTLLGIAASVQVTASNMVKLGDEICIDKYSIDGIVTDIRINNVKIQNIDNTIVTIPTYYLTSEIVKNWRGVKEYNARLIKRAINLDINSIKLCDNLLIAELHNNTNISALLDLQDATNSPIVNLTLYRKYVYNYLQQHPRINRTNPIIVRHLDPSINGLPLELYFYINYMDYAQYEITQAEIFEHCIIMLDVFKLRVLQIINTN